LLLGRHRLVVSTPYTSTSPTRRIAFLVAYELGHAKALASTERAYGAETEWPHAAISIGGLLRPGPATTGAGVATRGRPGSRVEAVTGFSIVCANAVIRLAYGAAAIANPSRPVLGKVPLAPDTEQFPEARLFVRGFAGHQVAVALVGLASLARRDLRRSAMALAAATDVADIASAAIEARSRSSLDSDLSGAIGFSSAGLASALVGLRLA